MGVFNKFSAENSLNLSLDFSKSKESESPEKCLSRSSVSWNQSNLKAESRKKLKDQN